MKKILSAVLAVCIFFGMSCSVKAMDIDFNELLGSLNEMTTESLQNDITMPDVFSITYEYANDGKYEEVTLEKDEEGNYHYKDSEDEYLFVHEGNGYKIAVGTINGFVYKNDDKYTFDYLQEQTSRFWDCVDPLKDEVSLGNTTEEGNGEICGRVTKKYKIEMGIGYNIGGYSMSMNESSFYEMDEETGICLASSSSEDFSVMGINSSDEGSGGFECIRFSVEDVDLPEVQ